MKMTTFLHKFLVTFQRNWITLIFLRIPFKKIKKLKADSAFGPDKIGPHVLQAMAD